MDRWLPDDVLLAIAAENNLAETAFVRPGADVSRLRWFTPTLEMDLCGHATLAAAHVLFCEYFPAAAELRFETCSGVLSVTRDGDVLCLDAYPGASEIRLPDSGSS